jgi:hypothetical protein
VLIWWRFHCKGLYPSRIKQQMSSSDSCAVIPVLTIRSGVGRSSQKCFHLSFINGFAYRRRLYLAEQLVGGEPLLIPHGIAVAYRRRLLLAEQLVGGDPLLIPHGNVVYDGLQLPAKEFG